jgi:hypothetical protein
LTPAPIRKLNQLGKIMAAEQPENITAEQLEHTAAFRVAAQAEAIEHGVTP